uniref:Uncharacterized protein n=1 Tax=candidate division CPR3 bacterium TaxID=2268181 RepID=A0A7C4R599_UNCC3
MGRKNKNYTYKPSMFGFGTVRHHRDGGEEHRYKTRDLLGNPVTEITGRNGRTSRESIERGLFGTAEPTIRTFHSNGKVTRRPLK